MGRGRDLKLKKKTICMKTIVFPFFILMGTVANSSISLNTRSGLNSAVRMLKSMRLLSTAAVTVQGGYVLIVLIVLIVFNLQPTTLCVVPQRNNAMPIFSSSNIPGYSNRKAPRLGMYAFLDENIASQVLSPDIIVLYIFIAFAELLCR